MPDVLDYASPVARPSNRRAWRVAAGCAIVATTVSFVPGAAGAILALFIVIVGSGAAARLAVHRRILVGMAVPIIATALFALVLPFADDYDVRMPGYITGLPSVATVGVIAALPSYVVVLHVAWLSGPKEV
jgi:ABC-type cobalamin transport system permease subunit